MDIEDLRLAIRVFPETPSGQKTLRWAASTRDPLPCRTSSTGGVHDRETRLRLDSAAFSPTRKPANAPSKIISCVDPFDMATAVPITSARAGLGRCLGLRGASVSNIGLLAMSSAARRFDYVEPGAAELAAVRYSCWKIAAGVLWGPISVPSGR